MGERLKPSLKTIPGSQIGKGFIQGMMGDDPVYLKTVPCGKHYLANNTEFNRHTGAQIWTTGI